MDKLMKYNQKLLAIIGTTIIAIAIITLIIGIVAAIGFFADFGGDYDDEGIQVREIAIEEEDTAFIRTQVITFHDPIQLDTAKAVFIIPVGQVNLEQNEKIGLVGSGSFSSSYRFDSYYGLYNNFILFEHESKQRTKIFDGKVALTNWANIKVGDNELLLFKGVSEDFNKDGLINLADFQSLYAFYISDKKLIKYSFEGKTVLSFELMNKTNLIAIRLGIDQNGNYSFDSSTEPQEILILNLDNRTVGNLIPPNMTNEIQQIMDK